MLEKKNLVVKSVGLLPNCIVKKKKKFIASLAIVLEERRLEKKFVVKIVLQYNFCIAEKRAQCIAGGVRLYCSIERKIVLQAGNCIATLGCWVQSVLQESAVAKIVLQHNRLYCNGCAVARTVLQHNKVYCKRVQWLELYCNITDCIAMGVQWLGLYCNTCIVL